MGGMVSFASNGATASGHLARPEGDAGPGVIVLQEFWGLNDQIKKVAERFAREGFVALAPDVYRGRIPQSRDEAAKLLMALNIPQAEKDLRGAVDHLRGITGKAVGTVGFCMGGALSLFAACANGRNVAAAVVYYGGHPKVEYDFDGLHAPVLGHWAEHDDFANANIPRFASELGKRGKPYEFHTYPGTKHAFFNEERPEVYDPAAAEKSWERTIAFLREHL
jgi:carboxymethylenebutenolidase